MRLPRPSLRRLGVALLVLVALVFAVRALVRRWSEIRDALADVSALPLALAAVVVLVSLVFSMLAWRGTVRAVGAEVPVPAAAQIFFVGQLGKYVPGSIWPFVAQMELGALHGLSRVLVGIASLLVLAIAVPVALALGLLSVPPLLDGDSSSYLLLFLVLPVALVALSPPVLNPVLSRGLRLLRRPALPRRVGVRDVVPVAVFVAVAHVLLGLHVWLLARDLGADGPEVLPLAIGAWALASVAGLLAVPLPAGAGVREAVLLAVLSAALPLAEALVLVLLSRLLLTAADLFCGGLMTLRLRAMTRDREIAA